MDSSIKQKDSKYPPVFIIASERSGTNLLRKRITEHQTIYFGPQPVHFLKHLYLNQPFYGDLLEDQAFSALIDDALDLCYIHYAPWEIDITVDQVLEDYDQYYSNRSIFGVMDFLLNAYARDQEYASYLCKDNNLFDFVPQLLHNFPNACFIYLYRDPRDVVLSQLKRKQQPNSIAKSSRLWKEEQLKCFQLFQQKFDEQTLMLSYESLIEQEERELNRIFDFLNTPPDAREKQKIKENDTTKDWKNLNRPTLKNNKNKYLNGLSKRQVQMVEFICRDEMKLLGYEQEYESRTFSATALNVNEFLGKLKYVARVFYYKYIKRKPILKKKKAERIKFIEKFKSI